MHSQLPLSNASLHLLHKALDLVKPLRLSYPRMKPRGHRSWPKRAARIVSEKGLGCPMPVIYRGPNANADSCQNSTQGGGSPSCIHAIGGEAKSLARAKFSVVKPRILRSFCPGSMTPRRAKRGAPALARSAQGFLPLLAAE